MTKKAKVIVIGAGPAGLAATHTLSRHDKHLDVTTLESQGHAGGRASGEIVDGFHVDRGATLLTEAYSSVRHFAEILNIPICSTWPGHTYIYGAGKLNKLLAGTTSEQRKQVAQTLLSSNLFSQKALFEFARFYQLANSMQEMLDFDDVSKLIQLDSPDSFQQYMESNSMDEFLKNGAEHYLGVTTGGSASELGTATAMATLWHFTMNPNRRLYSPRSGASAVLTALAEALTDHIILSNPVERIVIEGDSVKGVVCENGQRLDADAVVCSTPATVTTRIASDLPTDILYVLNQVNYSVVCKVAIGVDFEVMDDPAYCTMFPNGSDTPILLVENIKMISPDAVPEGKSLYYVLAVGKHAELLNSMSDAEISARIINEMQRFFPKFPNTPNFYRVYRWQEAGCLIQGGLMKDIYDMRKNRLQDVKGLFLAGDYTHLPFVNGGLRSGLDAADDCLQYLVEQSFGGVDDRN